MFLQFNNLKINISSMRKNIKRNKILDIKDIVVIEVYYVPAHEHILNPVATLQFICRPCICYGPRISNTAATASLILHDTHSR